MRVALVSLVGVVCEIFCARLTQIVALAIFVSSGLSLNFSR
jgi:hypothetical protein